MRVRTTQIGDLLMISKTSLQGVDTPSERGLYLTAEGILDSSLIASTIGSSQHPPECFLFQLQIPQKGAAKANKKAQKAISQRTLGTSVTFCQPLELRHVQSGYTVSIFAGKEAAHAGAVKALVLPTKQGSLLRFLPVDMGTKPGQPVRYGDRVSIVGELDGVSLCLGIASQPSEDGFEVHASLMPTEWMCHLFQSHESEEGSTLRTCVPVSILNVYGSMQLYRYPTDSPYGVS